MFMKIFHYKRSIAQFSLSHQVLGFKEHGLHFIKQLELVIVDIGVIVKHSLISNLVNHLFTRFKKL
jgi:hypothetical protein